MSTSHFSGSRSGVSDVGNILVISPPGKAGSGTKNILAWRIVARHLRRLRWGCHGDRHPARDLLLELAARRRRTQPDDDGPRRALTAPGPASSGFNRSPPPGWSFNQSKSDTMVLLEPRREPHQPDLPISLLAGVIAGTFTAGVNAAGPTWVTLPLGIAAPMFVGFLFPGAGAWQLVAGLLLVPMIAAFVIGEWLWLVLLTLPVAAGFTVLS
jgi:hypothetical protein